MNEISKSRANEIISAFQGKTIIIIGDIMLDRYIWGSVSRISPEAPVPVVKLSRETALLGGAGNVVSNIASLGGKASCFSVIGDDHAGKEIVRKLKNIGTDTDGLFEDHSRKTTMKTRVIAHSQQVVRIDREMDQPLSNALEARMIKKIIQRLEKSCSCLIISDYDKGVITKRLLRKVLPVAWRARIPVAIDPKLTNFPHYKPASIITPNLLEASRVTAIEFKNNQDILKAGNKIMRENRCRGVLITMGEKGMLLFQKGGKPIQIPTVAKEVYDVTGAGDTVISAIALSLASGASLMEASIIANHAAGIVVGKIGTAMVHPEELLESLSV
ncbi:MAG: D-glycero-beta-D-manno-heptose-7-phosphate kinase [Acidobacteriota bacterium]